MLSSVHSGQGQKPRLWVPGSSVVVHEPRSRGPSLSACLTVTQKNLCSATPITISSLPKKIQANLTHNKPEFKYSSKDLTNKPEVRYDQHSLTVSKPDAKYGVTPRAVSKPEVRFSLTPRVEAKRDDGRKTSPQRDRNVSSSTPRQRGVAEETKRCYRQFPRRKLTHARHATLHVSKTGLSTDRNGLKATSKIAPNPQNEHSALLTPTSQQQKRQEVRKKDVEIKEPIKIPSSDCKTPPSRGFTTIDQRRVKVKKTILGPKRLTCDFPETLSGRPRRGHNKPEASEQETPRPNSPDNDRDAEAGERRHAHRPMVRSSTSTGHYPDMAVEMPERGTKSAR